MPRRLLCFFALSVFACAHNHHAARPDFSSIDAAISARTEGENKLPSIAVALAQNGEIIHEAAFGFADLAEQRRATPDTPYPLASVTKPILATALLALAEKKKLDLDQPAHLYAGGWVSTDARYTVRQLLNHTSGLPTYATIRWSGESSPAGDLKTMFERYGFSAHPPGIVSEYSNLGYGLLGHILAEQSGTSLEDALQQQIFAPLGMINSALAAAKIPKNAAQKYDETGKLLPETINDTPGAGNIYASARDLLRFGNFHLDDRPSPILSPEIKELMRSYLEPGALYPYYNASPYGLGWYFQKRKDGTRVVWHEGGMPGASTLLVLLPEKKLAAVVLINANDKNDVAQSIAQQLLAKVGETIDPFVATDGYAPFEAQANYLGRWEGELTIDDKKLRCAMIFEPNQKTKLIFPEREPNDLLPGESSFGVLLNGDLLLGTFAATLPAQDVAQAPGGYVLLRLVRRNDQLNGTMIAYASPQGLRHLYPFQVKLRRHQ